MFLENLSIRKKLIYTILLGTIITGLLGSFIVIYYHIQTYKNDIVNDLTMHNNLISQSCVSPLSNHNKVEAADVLSHLKIIPTILSAQLFDENYKPFAQFSFNNSQLQPPNFDLKSHKQFLSFSGDYIYLCKTIVFHNHFYGIIYIVASTSEYWYNIKKYLITMASIMLLLMIFAYFLARFLQRFISGPILKLASFTDQVTLKKDYTLRIPYSYKSGSQSPASSFQLQASSSNDEIAILYNAVNNLLSQINKRETARNTAETALRDSENKNKSLIEAIPDMIYILDKFGKLLYFKAKDESMLPLPPDRILGSVLQDRGFSFEQTNNILLYIHKAISTNQIQTFEQEIKAQKGLIYAEVRLVALNNQEVLALIRDLTEQKQAKIQLEAEKIKSAAALEADKLKSAFLANMSHEIRTPMNAIIGFSNLLRDSDISETEKEEFINIINNSGEHLVHLIDDIIDISKIEAGQMVIKKSECSINPILTELYILFDNQKSSIGKQNVTLCLNIPDKDNNLSIITDSHRFKQIFNNLLSNALKFTEKGIIEFGYSTAPPEYPVYLTDPLTTQSYITFYVRDSGIGIPNNQLQEVFERFRKIEDRRTKLYGGAGLGLAISKNLVNTLGGNIWVESTPSKGSTFYFTLPYLSFNNISSSNNELLNNIFMNKKYLWKDKNILVVEDEDYVCKFFERILIPTKANILWAKNGIAAVNICNTDVKIDVVLMDMKLPELNGYEAVKRIKSHNSKLQIIAQTAYAMSEDRDMCLEVGCDDYISKPIDPEALLDKIQLAMNRNN